MAASPSVADAVVRAAAWDDGGVEYIYADGTILSFVDHMNTFVAVRTRPNGTGSLRTRHARGQRGAARDACTTGFPGHSGATAHTTEYTAGDDAPDEDAGRELCFTAWTLSRDVGKVRAALAIYNALAPHPRLLTTLLPAEAPSAPLDSVGSGVSTSSYPAPMGCAATATLPSGAVCGVWREPGPPIHTLLLAKRGDLFRRYPVVGTVREWLVQPSSHPRPSCSTNASPHRPAAHSGTGHDRASGGVNSSSADLARLQRSEETQPLSQTECHGTAPPREVVVGTVLELWCALRRVRLTVAVHRETFTVRWPAPVTRPDGSRLPPALHVHDAVAAVASAHAAPLLFTVVEQTFPVCEPPEPWRVMLELALELDATTPNGARHHEGPTAADAPRASRTAGAAATWQGSLPTPQRWGGARRPDHPAGHCRFSPLTATQAAHVAAPRTARALAAMRALHSPGARLRWVYEAPGCGAMRDPPPGVHWCVDADREAGSTTSPDRRGVDTVSWVGEDGSVVLTRLHGQGYTVTHHRVGPETSAPVLYRLPGNDVTSSTATADRRLPPTVAPLRCRYPAQSVGDVSGVDAGGCQDGGDAPLEAALRPRCDANVQQCTSASGACVQEARDSATARSAVAAIDAFSLRCVDDSLVQRDAAPETHGARTHRSTLHVAVRSCGDSGAAPCTVTPASVCRVLADLGLRGPSTVVLNRYDGLLLSPAQDEVARRAHLRCGRYLAAMVDAAVQLSQVNCAACRDDAASASASPFLPRPRPLLMSAVASEQRSGADSRTNADARPADVSAEPVVYLTRQLDGIGTFTALTNGTVRAQFDDRTLLTLIPGANELDEAQLLVSCVLRNATRVTVRAAQCHEGHAAYRYLAHALPFRRYVYWRAVHGEEEEEEEGDASMTAHTSSSLMGAPLLEASVGHLPSVPSCDLATSFGDVEERGVELQVTDSAHGDGAVVTSDLVPHSRRAAWGITDTREALGVVREREAAELRARAAKLQELLDTNDALSQATRALLRE